MSLILKSILNADTEARYLTPGELEPIKSFVKNGERRLRLVQALTENRERIVKQSGTQLFQKRPDVVSPGGNAYGQEMTATCLRDIDYYLRLITYSIVAGDATPIQEIGVIGAREMYRSLGTPIEAVAESIRAMKNITTSMMSAEDASEVGGYFDYLIAGLQ
ncbi:allophycocyanin subunit alpha apoprotein [Calothrix sp. PCC 7507]|uniref:allophycocyanin subunit alpha apoprotein n=1 Tax=Calothrix sp. PCC 7507 TaxID=99598 RepID=UPI00029EF4EA|nr:allophycocyanin subunit alpha apoprotein [Calothrix sp. PCC 7507]AFY35851.1 allophycocyanin alpha subunit apoprotein [Calothrix sp. PCC 7507]